VVVLAGLGIFAITEPHAAGSAFKSTKALVIMGAVGVGWVLARLATLVVVRWPGVRMALFGLAGLVILKVVVLPAYDDHTVIEALPAQPVVAVSVPAGVPPPTVQPVKISSGPLRGIDHRASGTVNVYRQPDTHLVIGLEDFDIQPGPAYALYVVAGADREDVDQGTRIERLRGNKGSQFYDAPDDVDLAAGPWTVLVWCETFDVPVANATPLSL
jgi:hypothetical protein